MPSKPQLEPPRHPLPPLSILRMLWKHKALAVGCCLAASIASVFIVRSLPSIYQAEAVVLVDSQKIPENLVSSTITEDVADRLALISQSIMSDASLLEIINTYNLYANVRASLTQEELLRRMHKDISVTVEKSWTGGRMQAFRLRYEGRNPKIVAAVANRLAKLYVNENGRFREDQAKGTVDFLQQQLRGAKASLDRQEARVAKFKAEHMGELPEQENSLLTTLSNLRVELQGIEQQAERAQDSLAPLEAGLSSAQSAEETLLSNALHASAETAISSGAMETPKLKSEILEQQLRDLLTRYTPDFPDVQQLEEKIRQVKLEEAGAASDIKETQSTSTLHQGDGNIATEGKKSAPLNAEVLRARERIATFQAQIDATKKQIKKLENERQQALAAIADAETRVNKLPLIEQDMASLKRDYDESANNYNSLLQKELTAGMATDMEEMHKSERFTVVDPAPIPQKPVKPKLAVLIAAGTIAGLMIGLAIGFGLEFRKQTFLGEWELPSGTLVLGRVPIIAPTANS